jgi:hypothetical protein
LGRQFSDFILFILFIIYLYILVLLNLCAGRCNNLTKEAYYGAGRSKSLQNIGYSDICVIVYYCHWMFLHFDIDKWSIKGNESKSRINQSPGSKKESRGIKQL